jgi:magnesium transporter
LDRYFDVLEGLGEGIEQLEENLTENPSPDRLRAIRAAKREMILLRRAVWPLREIVDHLARRESGLIGREIEIYFRDVYDHVIQLMDTIEILRDILSGMLDVYLSSVSNKLNEVMKVLTIIATLFIPLTFIAGVYGMNFRHMPELEWRWGYPAVWGIMLVSAAAMLAYFRRKGWL